MVYVARGGVTSAATGLAYLYKEKENSSKPRVMFEASQGCMPATALQEFAELRREYGRDGETYRPKATYVTPAEVGGGVQPTHVRVMGPKGRRRWVRGDQDNPATHVRIEHDRRPCAEVNHWILSFSRSEANPDDPDQCRAWFDHVRDHWAEHRSGTQMVMVGQADGESGLFHIHVMENAIMQKDMEWAPVTAPHRARSYRAGQRVSGPMTIIDDVRALHDHHIDTAGRDRGLVRDTTHHNGQVVRSPYRETQHDRMEKEAGRRSEADRLRDSIETTLASPETHRDLAKARTPVALKRAFAPHLQAHGVTMVTDDGRIRAFERADGRYRAGASRLGTLFTDDAFTNQLREVSTGVWRPYRSAPPAAPRPLSRLSTEEVTPVLSRHQQALARAGVTSSTMAIPRSMPPSPSHRPWSPSSTHLSARELDQVRDRISREVRQSARPMLDADVEARIAALRHPGLAGPEVIDLSRPRSYRWPSTTEPVAVPEPVVPTSRPDPVPEVPEVPAEPTWRSALHEIDTTTMTARSRDVIAAVAKFEETHARDQVQRGERLDDNLVPTGVGRRFLDKHGASLDPGVREQLELRQRAKEAASALHDQAQDADPGEQARLMFLRDDIRRQVATGDYAGALERATEHQASTSDPDATVSAPWRSRLREVNLDSPYVRRGEKKTVPALLTFEETHGHQQAAAGQNLDDALVPDGVHHGFLERYRMYIDPPVYTELSARATAIDLVEEVDDQIAWAEKNNVHMDRIKELWAHRDRGEDLVARGDYGGAIDHLNPDPDDGGQLHRQPASAPTNPTMAKVTAARRDMERRAQERSDTSHQSSSYALGD